MPQDNRRASAALWPGILMTDGFADRGIAGWTEVGQGSSISTADLWGCPMPCRAFGGIHGPYPLAARSAPSQM